MKRQASMNQTFKTAGAFAVLMLGLLDPAHAEDRPGLEISFSDPGRRMEVQIEIDSDEDVLIRGYEGKTVVVEPRAGKPASKLAELGTTARERDNVLALRLAPTKDLSLRVPRNASLQISSSRHGNVQVEHVDGEIEATGLNGSLTVIGGSGSLVATSQDGRITAHFGSLPAKKLISLRNLDGTIELSLPATARAHVTLESHDGQVHSDFALRDAPGGKGSEQRLSGEINGGGAEVHLTTHDGTVNLLQERIPGTNATSHLPIPSSAR
ncbi:MAG TPA: DUF4097 family beta strand repeat-containing protein [Candidatus Limnocylindria bacterium]|jgi:hypothetical protein|nr:DUF4097 family beta strand repeat-containing protein [Candidatus Limnocylindria bacterium]